MLLGTKLFLFKLIPNKNKEKLKIFWRDFACVFCLILVTI